MTRREDLINFESLPPSGGQAEGDNIAIDDLAGERSESSNSHATPNIQSLADEPLNIKVEDDVAEARGIATNVLSLPPDTGVPLFLARREAEGSFDPEPNTDPSSLATTQELSQEPIDPWADNVNRTALFDVQGVLDESNQTIDQVSGEAPEAPEFGSIPRTGSFIAEQVETDPNDQFRIPETQEYAVNGEELQLTYEQKLALLHNYADNERAAVTNYRELNGHALAMIKRPSSVEKRKKVIYLILQTDTETLIMGDVYGHKLGETKIQQAFDRMESVEKFRRRSAAIEQIEEFHLELQVVGGRYSHPRTLEDGLLCVVQFNGNPEEESKLLQKLDHDLRMREGESATDYIKRRLPFSNMLYMMQAMKGKYGLVLKRPDGDMQLFAGSKATEIEIEALAEIRKAIIAKSEEDRSGMAYFEALSSSPEKRAEILRIVGKPTPNQ